MAIGFEEESEVLSFDGAGEEELSIISFLSGVPGGVAEGLVVPVSASFSFIAASRRKTAFELLAIGSAGCEGAET